MGAEEHSGSKGHSGTVSEQREGQERGRWDLVPVFKNHSGE